MQRLCRGLIALALLTANARAADAPFRSDGELRIGSDARDARFAINCVMTTGPRANAILSVHLAVPRFDEVGKRFPFEVFEGPDGDGGVLSTLEASSPGSTVKERFSASGAIGVDNDVPFVFEVNGTRSDDPRRLFALARLLGALRPPAATLTWQQDAPKRGPLPLRATLNLTAGDLEQLHARIAPCMKAAGIKPTAPAAPPPVKQIHFAPGASVGEARGGIVRGERALYAINAASGQQMTVRITSPENNAVFQLYWPGARAEMEDGAVRVDGTALRGANEGDDATQWSGALPASGNYLIVIGGTRGNAAYSLNISIK